MALKLALAITLLLGCSLQASAQETIYLGADSLPSSMADAKFKLVVQPADSFPYHLQFFLLDSNKLLQEGPALDKSLSSRTGTWKGYFTDSKSYYFAQYAGSQLSGTYRRYYADSVVYAKGHYVADKMEGTWQWYHNNAQLASEEIWASDSLVQIVSQFEPDGAPSPTPWSIETKTIALNFQQVVASVMYPDEAKDSEITGIVHVKVLVDTAGLPANLSILKSVHPLLDNEALRVSQKLRFNQARSHNIPVKVWVIAPFNFKLE